MNKKLALLEPFFTKKLKEKLDEINKEKENGREVRA